MQFNSLIPELFVSNIERSLKFYIEKLGFEVVFSRLDEGFYFVAKEGSQLMLNQLKEGSWVNGKPTKPFGSGMNLAFKVETLSEFHDSDLSNSIFFDYKDYEYKTGDEKTKVRQVTFEDPDGYLIRFIEQLK